jgi:hypothetical protein
MVFHFSHVENL